MKILFVSPEITPFAKTGGLADRIHDGINGFTFFDFEPHFFFHAVKRAIDVYRNHPDKWEEMMVTAMAQDFSWNRSTGKYLDLYHQLLSELTEIGLKFVVFSDEQSTCRREHCYNRP